MLLHTQILGDGPQNVTLRIRGRAGFGIRPESGRALCFEARQLQAGFRTLQLTSALWTLNEKMGLLLWTHEAAEDPAELLLLMESRNGLRPDRPYQLPADWDGRLWLEPFNLENATCGWFSFTLEMDKIGRAAR